MHFQSDDPLQGLELLDALRRGETVAVQGDRPRTGTRSVDGQLFGRPFPLASGPAALARAAGVQLLPVYVIARTRADKGALLHQPKLVGARQQVTLPRVFSSSPAR
jgi:lauroyl/myristoyl acyltransferase